MSAALPLLGRAGLPSADRTARLRERLLEWYRAERRELPWRGTRDAYAVWISEAMLQQTRVETAREYYGRFLGRFPTVRALADADEDDVLAAWSGLGYYRRARALHAAARLIVSEHGGEFPREPAAALALPGIGRYTAGAVLSIAFDRPCALVDGNVERVFSRLFGLDAAAGSKPLQDACWTLAERFVPARGAGDWNQALMELGATICTPRAPHCDACPLARSCAGRRAGTAASLPGPKARPETIEVEMELALAREDGRWLLERRPPGGRMAGMWQLPGVERTPPGREEALLFPTGWRDGARLTLGEVLFTVRHTITRHRIRARARSASAESLPPDTPYRWFAPGELSGLPLTGMTKKALTRLPS